MALINHRSNRAATAWIATICMTFALCGCFLPVGQSQTNKYDAEFSTIFQEFHNTFFEELRLPLHRYEIARQSGQEHLIRNRGTVPVDSAYFNSRDICGRGDRPCASYVFGDSLSKNTELRVRIERWFTNFCVSQKRSVLEPRRFDDPTSLLRSTEKRNREFTELRAFLGCDSASKQIVEIHLYLIRDPDLSYGGSDDKAREVFLGRVIEHKVLRVNH
jgi:hypothetical protein